MKRLAMLPLLALLLVGCGSGEPPDTGTPAAAATVVADAAGPQPADTAPVNDEEPAPEPGEIITQELAYGGTEDHNFVGYFAAPSLISEPLPGIVLVHERWGLDDGIRTIARNLAAAGYAVLAVDLFAGNTADNAADAQALTDIAATDREASLGNIGQAIDYLRAYALAPRIAVVGFGLGGGLALESAVTMPEKLDAIVTYYGRLIFDEVGLEKLRAPVIGFYAGEDESIPTRDVQAFRRLLAETDRSAEILIYPAAAHGFADPTRGSYDPMAAEEAWAETLDFLARTLRVRQR